VSPADQAAAGRCPKRAHYAKGPHGLERCDELRGVAAATMAAGSGADPAYDVRGILELSRYPVQIKRFFQRRPEMPVNFDRATRRGR
jgi:hypothetical protein